MHRLKPFALLAALGLAQGLGCSGATPRPGRSAALASSHAGDAAAGAPSAERSDAEYAKHVEELRKRLPSSEFSVVVQRPFVVVGDGPEAAVRRHADDTVKWAVDLLKKG